MGKGAGVAAAGLGSLSVAEGDFLPDVSCWPSSICMPGGSSCSLAQGALPPGGKSDNLGLVLAPLSLSSSFVMWG